VASPGTSPPEAALGSAVVFCDACGRETVHRILRLDRTKRSASPRAVAGVARCRECRWTHPFVSARPSRVEVEVIVSRGAESQRRTLELPPGDLLQVGEPVPGVEPVVRVQRLDRLDGRPSRSSPARELRTVWAVAEGPRFLRVAVLQGARSTTEKLAAAPGLRLEVGAPLRLPGGAVTIVALRARQQTWRRPGDAFPAGEVTVVYGRRTVSPPAGRSPWSRVRGTSSSRASSVSRSARSRSSPGVSRNRTVPRARTAAGGATVRNSSSP